MDFIERWFHVSPDGGNGSLELLYLVVMLAVVLLVLFRHRLGDAFARSRAARGDDRQSR